MSQPNQTCTESLVVGSLKLADCALPVAHDGLHVASFEDVRSTGQRTIDGGILQEKVRYSISWSFFRWSSND